MEMRNTAKNQLGKMNDRAKNQFGKMKVRGDNGELTRTNLAFKFNLLFILVGKNQFEYSSQGGTRMSLTLYGAYHFARRVLPLW